MDLKFWGRRLLRWIALPRPGLYKIDQVVTGSLKRKREGHTGTSEGYARPCLLEPARRGTSVLSQQFFSVILPRSRIEGTILHE